MARVGLAEGSYFILYTFSSGTSLFSLPEDDYGVKQPMGKHGKRMRHDAVGSVSHLADCLLVSSATYSYPRRHGIASIDHDAEAEIGDESLLLWQ